MGDPNRQNHEINKSMNDSIVNLATAIKYKLV